MSESRLTSRWVLEQRKAISRRKWIGVEQKAERIAFCVATHRDTEPRRDHVDGFYVLLNFTILWRAQIVAAHVGACTHPMHNEVLERTHSHFALD